MEGGFAISKFVIANVGAAVLQRGRKEARLDIHGSLPAACVRNIFDFVHMNNACWDGGCSSNER